MTVSWWTLRADCTGCVNENEVTVFRDGRPVRCQSRSKLGLFSRTRGARDGTLPWQTLLLVRPAAFGFVRCAGCGARCGQRLLSGPGFLRRVVGLLALFAIRQRRRRSRFEGDRWLPAARLVRDRGELRRYGYDERADCIPTVDSDDRFGGPLRVRRRSHRDAVRRLVRPRRHGPLGLGGVVARSVDEGVGHRPHLWRGCPVPSRQLRAALGVRALRFRPRFLGPRVGRVHLHVPVGHGSGNANTYSACPRFGGRNSGVIVAGTWRGLPPPSPVATATYCLPPTAKLIGKPCTDVASRVSKTTLPLRTSTPLKLRSRSPANATPPAVDSTEVMNDARCSSDHTCSSVSTLNAASLPTLPFVPGIV